MLLFSLVPGIRVSECVGLDVEDVDFKNNGIKVTRKGGNEMVVYFGPEVEKASEEISGSAGRILRLWPAMSTLSSILPSVAGSVSRLSRIWLKNMPGRSQLQKRSPRISCAAPMVLPCTRKPVIFTL